MLGSKAVKHYAFSLGADLCGIAPAGRFGGAPAGFRPEDIFPDCRAIVVFARKFPAWTLLAGSGIPYTHACDVLTAGLDWLGLELSLKLEEHGIGAVPVPAERPFVPRAPGEPEAWGILSLRHAGYKAGLGVIGKSALLVNKDFGSLMHLGAVMVDAELEPDPLATYTICRANCRECIDACPVEALDGAGGIDMGLCHTQALMTTPGGQALWQCTQCRRVCPNNHLE